LLLLFFVKNNQDWLEKFVKNSGFVVSELVAGSGEQEDTRNKKLKDIFLVRKSAVNTTTSNQRNCHLRHDCH